MSAVSQTTAPQVGSLVRVRGRRWVVGASEPGDHAVVELNSIEDGRYGESLSVIWNVEVDARLIDAGALPQPGTSDPPESVAAFLDAARWSSATSADIYHLQAPFRAGVSIEDYQLEPLARALVAPRVNLLLADDVGLGKTIEAGLVALELLLRHRARSVLIVCPAGLTAKWQVEMAEKFGLDFTIVDAEECARLRRVRGSAANPFRSHQLIIVSLPWLRTARAQRLLNEVLPTEVDPRRRTFDLLILDEAHHVAPAAPKQRYAVDSQQIKLIRSITPHCEHKLFLSATPHNGYPESFQALLALIDDQQFVRGLPPNPVAQRETVIRRLKADVTSPVDGDSSGATFLPRKNAIIEVGYTDEERRAYDLLTELVAQRRRRRRGRGPGRRTDVLTLLLKKRLYSSPAAFASTVDVVRAGGRSASAGVGDEELDAGWADEFMDTFDERDTYGDDDREDAENAALRRAEQEALVEDGAAELPADEDALLDQMRAWAAPYAHRADTKAQALIDYLVAVCRPDPEHWLNERVVVFTEYRDTLVWLEDLLRREGLTLDHRVALLHGGMPAADREKLRQEFQTDPSQTKIRILLATDAAAEGIDLHWHCHRLVNYDIPFNPNRLEQRIGRIDRYGQTEPPEVRHFVSSGWRQRGAGFDGDTEFLYRIATKITQVEADLGSANPVLAAAVQRVMLGQRVDLDAVLAPSSRARISSDAGVRDQVARLRAQLDATIDELQITPDRVRRLVSTGLRLARQAPLLPVVDPDPLWSVPPLTGTWVRATDSLAHPLRPTELRPITFDPAVAKRRREDVVQVHLNHPLVAMSTQLMSAASASGQTELSRTTAVVGHHLELTEPLVVAYARFLVVGGDAIRLHEEMIHAGGWVRADGRFARLENLGLMNAIVGEALTGSELPAPAAEQALVDSWPRLEPGLIAAINWRVGVRREQVERALRGRCAADLKRNETNFERFATSLADGLTVPDQEELAWQEPTELAQRDRDRDNWQERLQVLHREQEGEAERIAARYGGLSDHTFSLAVVLVLPPKPNGTGRG